MTDNPLDWNGHVPADPREDVARDSRDPHEGAPLCPYDRDQPDLRCAWMEGYLAAVGIIAAHGQRQLTETLEKLERRSAA